MKKTKETSYSFKQEIIKSFGKRKIETVGIVIALLLVVFDFLAYSRSLFSIFMLSGITIYVIYYFLQSILLFTRLRLALAVLESDPDFKAFSEEMQKLTPEQIEEFRKIQELNVQKAKDQGQEVKSVLEE